MAEGPGRPWRAVIHPHRAKKSLGQHFLVSESVLSRVAALCREAAEGVEAILEIGPGRGALTRHLLDTGLPVRAVELDGCLARELGGLFPGLEVAEGDGRAVRWPDLPGSTGLSPWLLAGNLPYNAATEILLNALAHPAEVKAAAVMVQREVALKFTARPGGEGYGWMAAWTAAWWEGAVRLHVRPGSFSPPPRVQSSFLVLRRLRSPSLSPECAGTYRVFLEAAFRQPRRTLASNLARSLRSGGRPSPVRLSGIPPVLRAAQAAPEDLARLFLGC
ncbi:MAG: 16S rRNA (adenine(1518)-N(6)/adenine(1519)-N(6))-dimethyltransferase RsmA [Acidobacteriota bacterium]